jgi:hypothetical protein
MIVVWIKALFQYLNDDTDKNRTQNIGPRDWDWEQAPFEGIAVGAPISDQIG